MSAANGERKKPDLVVRRGSLVLLSLVLYLLVGHGVGWPLGDWPWRWVAVSAAATALFGSSARRHWRRVGWTPRVLGFAGLTALLVLATMLALLGVWASYSE